MHNAPVKNGLVKKPVSAAIKSADAFRKNPKVPENFVADGVTEATPIEDKPTDGLSDDVKTALKAKIEGAFAGSTENTSAKDLKITQKQVSQFLKDAGAKGNRSEVKLATAFLVKEGLLDATVKGNRTTYTAKPANNI